MTKTDACFATNLLLQSMYKVKHWTHPFCGCEAFALVPLLREYSITQHE